METQDTNQNQSAEVPAGVPVAENQLDNDKLWSILSYIPLLFLIPLVAVPNRSSFVNYHINQGIILTLIVIAGNFGLELLPWWFKIVGLVIWALNLFSLTLAIVGIKNVLEKKTIPLPLVGKLFTFLK
jgi:uncharacterized membrane protein